MKTNLFLSFLVLCAVSGYNSQPIREDDLFEIENFGLEEVLEALKKIAENLAKEIKRVVEEPQADFTTKVDKILGALLESTEEALRELQTLNDDLLNEKIESLPEGKQRECLEKLQPKTKEISAQYITDLRKCGESARESLVQSVQKVENIIVDIKRVGTGLQEAIIKCAESNRDNIQEAVICAAKETQNGRRELGRKLRDLGVTLAKETVALTRTALRAKSCTKEVVRDATDRLREAVNEVSECNDNNLLY